MTQLTRGEKMAMYMEDDVYVPVGACFSLLETSANAVVHAHDSSRAPVADQNAKHGADANRAYKIEQNKAR